MYPNDDLRVRARLLIARSRAARQRLEKLVAHSLELRAHVAAARESRALPPPSPPLRHPRSRGGG